MNLIYEDLRTAVFHAKTSRPVVLPQSDPSARRTLVDGLRVLGEVVKALAEHQLHVRRPSGGIFAGFWRMQTSGPAQRAKLAVTPTAELLHDGADPGDDPELLYLHTRPAPEYDFPFATSILGIIGGSAVADAGRLSHFYSFVDNTPWTGGTPDGALEVGSLSRLEILLQLRAENTRPLRTRFSTWALPITLLPSRPATSVLRQLLVDMTERGAGLRILHTLEVPVPSAIDDSIQNHPTPRLPKEIVARSLLEERLLLAGRARFQAKLRLQFDCPLEVDAESPGRRATLRTPLPLVD